jgi:hypothetical protein
MSDTWRFDGTNWAFWGGSKNIDEPPSYGAKKSFSFDYHPGCRDLSSVTVTTTRSAAYIIGGRMNGAGASYGDIWKFESDKGWALWAGDVENIVPVPGTKKVSSPSNVFGSKRATMPVVDEFDNIWIFGGVGRVPSLGSSM